MKSLIAKFIPGIVLITAALLAFAVGNARAESKGGTAQQTSATAQPPKIVERDDCCADGQPATASAAPAGQVVYIVVRQADVIQWAPAYYGPQYCDTRPLATDPFTEVRVNPIPWPANYVAPQLFSPIREFHHGRNARR